MKYILMMSAPSGPYEIFNWPKQDFDARLKLDLRNRHGYGCIDDLKQRQT